MVLSLVPTPFTAVIMAIAMPVARMLNTTLSTL